MKKDEAEILLTDETREIVAAYLRKRQKVKKPVSKEKAEYNYDFQKLKKK
ncbi:MAG TPA: hypothetical protein VK212_06075 [Lentimicrobium sp.]|nr:hypothetical protein [Lentimicrobium sp.]